MNPTINKSCTINKKLKLTRAALLTVTDSSFTSTQSWGFALSLVNATYNRCIFYGHTQPAISSDSLSTAHSITLNSCTVTGNTGETFRSIIFAKVQV